MRSVTPAGLLAFAAMMLACATQSLAESRAGTAAIVGHWEGTLRAGAPLRLVLHIEEQNGELVATMDSPDQGATGIAVDDISFADAQLRFSINAIRGSYKARLKGGTLKGSWRQSGATLRLNLRRVTAPTAILRPQTPSPPFDYTSTDVTFGSADGATMLGGTLVLPRSETPSTTIVLISGSGPQDRDGTLFGHKPLLVIADYLARHGYATLRYDDRGVAGSSGVFADATIEHFSDDAQGAVQFLAQRDDVSNIGILGHSEGAMVGDLAAASQPAVSFLIRLAGPAVDAESLLVAQSVAIYAAQGGKPEHHLALAALNRSLYALAASDRNQEQLLTDAITVLQDNASRISASERKALGLDTALEAKATPLAAPWFRDFIRRDAGAALARVSVPVLAVYGGHDTQVQSAQNAPAAQQRLVHELSRVSVYEDLNHLFQPSVTGAPGEYAQIEQTLAPRVLSDIVQWLSTLPSRR